MNKLFKTLLSATVAVALASGLTACNDSDTGGTFTDMNIFTPQATMGGVILRFDKTTSVIPTNGDQLLTQVPYLFNSEKPLRALVSYSYEVNENEPTVDPANGRLKAQVLGIDSICTTYAHVIDFSVVDLAPSDEFNLNLQRYTFIADGFLNIHYEINTDGYWNDRKNGSPNFVLMASKDNPGNFLLHYNAGSHKGGSAFNNVAAFDISRVPGIQNVKTINVRYGTKTMIFELGENGIYGATAAKSES